MRFPLLLGVLLLSGIDIAFAGDVNAGPSDYRTKLGQLQPGDTLVLATGNYTSGLAVDGLNGTPTQWITIRSADKDNPAVILGRSCCNTVEITDCSYLAFEDLTIDGQDIDGIHAFSAKDGESNLTHDIRIEGCLVVNHGNNQQTDGISTKCPTWGWIVRSNTIVGAGTAIYLGDSDGSDPFIGGLIENNLIVDPEGYCMQIKHQNARPAVQGMPATPQVTIIRHNVFIKTDRPSGDGDRPNLLLGALPATGNGAQDRYDIYGNFFYNNPREYLMQAEGRVAIHDNVFVSDGDGAINLGDHNRDLDLAYVYNNTIYGPGTGILLRDLPDEDSALVGNLVFAGNPKSGTFASESGNILASVNAASQYVTNPSFTLGSMDFYPLQGPVQGPVQGAALDLGAFTGQVDYDRDFNGDSKGSFLFRGAYAGEGVNPGWQLDQALKGFLAAPPPPPPPGDTTPPTGTVTIDGGATTTGDIGVTLTLSATDTEGAVTLMEFSNDGTTWSPPMAFDTPVAWDLASYGGNATPGMKTVYARFQDDSGNWSDTAIVATIELQAAPGGPPLPPEPSTGGGAAGPELLLLAAAALLLRRRRNG